MSVQEYIDKHELSKKVEELINATVKAKPDEPLSFMVRAKHQTKGRGGSFPYWKKLRLTKSYLGLLVFSLLLDLLLCCWISLDLEPGTGPTLAGGPDA